MIISRRNSSNNDIELLADASFYNNDTLLVFNLDSRLSYTKQIRPVCVVVVITSCETFIPPEIYVREIY